MPQKKSMQDCRSAGVACQVVCIGAGEDVRFIEAVEAANSEADSRKLGEGSMVSCWLNWVLWKVHSYRICDLCPSGTSHPRAFPPVAVFLTVDDALFSFRDQAQDGVSPKT